jgi:hypothetical protein
VVAAAAPYGATLTVPATVAAGSYALTVTEAGASGGASMTMLVLDVRAAQTLNAGLRSNTGWVEPQITGSTGSPLVAVGVGLMLIAGLGTVAVLQGRRTRA